MFQGWGTFVSWRCLWELRLVRWKGWYLRIGRYPHSEVKERARLDRERTCCQSAQASHLDWVDRTELYVVVVVVQSWVWFHSTAPSDVYRLSHFQGLFGGGHVINLLGANTVSRCHTHTQLDKIDCCCNSMIFVLLSILTLSNKVIYRILQDPTIQSNNRDNLIIDKALKDPLWRISAKLLPCEYFSAQQRSRVNKWKRMAFQLW